MASIVNQDGKNKGNHMMGQCILLDLNVGDEVYVYTFTGTWTADWPHIHFTQFVGGCLYVYYAFSIDFVN